MVELLVIMDATMELGSISTGVGLLKTVFEFIEKHTWRGSPKLAVSAYTYAAVGSERDKLVVMIPLVFHHQASRPIVLEGLRLVQVPNHGAAPVVFTAIMPNLGGPHSDRMPQRVWATPIVIPPGQAVTNICQFLRKPGNLSTADLLPFRLEVRLAGAELWQSIRTFRLSFTERFSIRSFEQP